MTNSLFWRTFAHSWPTVRRHAFLVHANLLRTCTNVVDFRVMRRAEDCMPSPMKFTSEIYKA